MPGADDKNNFFQLMPIKIFGFRYLNRAMHLDRVFVKLCDWNLWGIASQKTVQHINFKELDQVQEYFEWIKKEKGEEYQIEEILDSIKVDEENEEEKGEGLEE